MKYLLYRSFGNLEKDVKKHELVAVEYGKDIDDVADALIKARGVVSEHRGHRFYVHPVLQGHGREGVAEIMKAYSR